MNIELKLDRRFKNKVKGMFGKYQFEVGVLEDRPHYEARRGKSGLKGRDVLKSYAGGPARKVSRATSQTVSEVSRGLRSNLRFNYLKEPFKKRNSDILKFSREFFKLVFGRSKSKRAENLLQAVVRNPMLRGDYGHNSKLTKRIKGFDRITIDTAQLFRNIKARVKRRV